MWYSMARKASPGAPETPSCRPFRGERKVSATIHRIPYVHKIIEINQRKMYEK